ESLRSLIAVFVVQLTRTRAWLVAGPVTVQLKVPVLAPVFGTDEATTVQVLPPLRLTSRRMDALVPRLWLPVIPRTLPTGHVPRVWGGAPVTAGAAPVTFASLVSLAPGLPVHVTRTRAVVVFGLVTVQVKAPLLATEGASVLHVAPPSRLSSTRMTAEASRL